MTTTSIRRKMKLDDGDSGKAPRRVGFNYLGNLKSEPFPIVTFWLIFMRLVFLI